MENFIQAIFCPPNDHYDGELIPLGNIAPVDGTPFDFRKIRQIDNDVGENGIYDHNFMLNGEHAATMLGDKSGIKMEVYTDMPAVQIYTGSGGKNTLNKANAADRGGVATEPQFAPNAINAEGFKKPILRVNVRRSHYIGLTFYSCCETLDEIV